MKTVLFFVVLFVSIQIHAQSISLDNKSTILFQQSFIICYGDSIIVDTNVYTKTGEYKNVLKSRNGLDSIVTTFLTVKPEIDVSTTIDTTTILVKETDAKYQWIDCYNDNLPIASINQWYTAKANGGYAVIVSKNGCSDTSKCVIIDFFTSNGVSSSVSVVPAINNGIFMVNALKKMNSIIVVDILGNVVHKNKPTDLRTMVTIKDKPNGIYFLCVATEGKKEIFKIEKQ